ncbi:hypothetical protein EV421DRAFT_1745178 [Armillaria borealis]|uniref:Uncharacterized protein n=1 Tax=Armillaria borealis TaxID=47425 RepID=A0AA39ISQ5_9AGAR|nr:hypothetical protein EV421DRAFT_1745178 [Armillaria borealis]
MLHGMLFSESCDLACPHQCIASMFSHRRSSGDGFLTSRQLVSVNSSCVDHEEVHSLRSSENEPLPTVKTVSEDSEEGKEIVYPHFPQEIMDKIVWEAAEDIIAVKTTSISSRVLIAPSQKSLFTHITVTRKRTPELWLDIFEEFPLFRSYVRSVTIRNVTALWESSLRVLVQSLDTGSSLDDLYITHTSFRPSLEPLLNVLWPIFGKVVIQNCTLTESSLKHMLQGAVRMKSLCIGFADRHLLSSKYCGHWMVDRSVEEHSIASFYYFMDYGHSAFLESDAFRRCLFPRLNALKDLMIRADYIVSGQVQHIISGCSSTLVDLDVLFICGRTELRRAPLDLRECTALTTLTLGEDVARLVVMIRCLRSMPKASRLNDLKLVMYASYPLFWPLDWVTLRGTITDTTMFPSMRSLTVEFYFYRESEDRAQMHELVEFAFVDRSLLDDMTQDRYGLLYHLNMLRHEHCFLGRSHLKETLFWKRIGAFDALCMNEVDDKDYTPQAATLSLVTIPSTKDWYNKLSGLGNVNDTYPREMSALKWLLHLTPPTGTIFMNDWDNAMVILEHAQSLAVKNSPNDLMVMDKGKISALRGTAKVFKKRISGLVDVASLAYKVPEPSRRDYMNLLRTFPGSYQYTEPEWQADPYGYFSREIITFQINHCYIEATSRDSFSACLKSIKVLVPAQELPKVIREMGSIDSTTLERANAYDAFLTARR